MKIIVPLLAEEHPDIVAQTSRGSYRISLVESAAPDRVVVAINAYLGDNLNLSEEMEPAELPEKLQEGFLVDESKRPELVGEIISDLQRQGRALIVQARPRYRILGEERPQLEIAEDGGAVTFSIQICQIVGGARPFQIAAIEQSNVRDARVFGISKFFPSREAAVQAWHEGFEQWFHAEALEKTLAQLVATGAGELLP